MVWVGVGILVLYLFVIVLVSWISVHPIRTPLFLSPGSMGSPQENVEFPSMDGKRLVGWWVEGEEEDFRFSSDDFRAEESGGSVENQKSKIKNPRPPVAILFHGYLMTRSEMAPVAHRLWEEGFSCLLIDFRAHGHSGGKVCGVGWLERLDVLAAVQFARERLPNCRIMLMGSSMGAAASAFAAAEDASVDALVLDCAYSRLASGALGWWRFVGGKALSFILSPTVLLAAPFVKVNPYKVDVAKALAKAKVPTLLIHGDSDKLALPSEAERNLAACGDLGKLVWMPNSNHGEGRWVHPELYYGAILSFLRENEFLEG